MNDAGTRHSAGELHKSTFPWNYILDFTVEICCWQEMPNSRNSAVVPS